MPASPVARKAGSSSPARRGAGSPSGTLKKSTSERSLKASAKAKSKGKERTLDRGQTGHRPSDMWIRSLLEAINSRRAKHHACPLVWSDECFVHARFQANACMAAGKKLRPNYIECLDGTHGQSIAGPYKATPLHFNATIAEKIVATWYDEISKYDFAKPGPTPKAKNFTQMVWTGSTSVGVALSSDGKFCVANYFPAGNAHPLDFPKCIQPVKKGAPPWEPHPPKASKENPCSEANWERYEKVAAALAVAENDRRIAALRKIKPEDMTPGWPRPSQFFTEEEPEPAAELELEEEEAEEEDEEEAAA